MKKKIINVLKFVGLFFAIREINGLPAILMVWSRKIPFYAESLLAIVFLMGILVLIRVMWGYYKRYLSEEVKSQSFTKKDILPLVGYTLLGYIASIVGAQLTFFLSGQSMPDNQAAIDSVAGLVDKSHLPSSLLFILGISVLTPIMEELIFRGFGIVYFFQNDRSLAAGLVTSSLFAFAHLLGVYGIDWVSFPIYFLMGGAIYLSYAYRRNLKDAMVIHIMKNTLLGIILLLSMFA
ncbi:type II CAAX endopeptidase family protein [Streptococcus pneumoniae]